MKFDSGNQATNFFHAYLTTAINILGGRNSVWVPDENRVISRGQWVTPPATREWYARDVQRYQLHPVISDVIEKRHYRPLNWHLLALEFPHRSTVDFNRLAYTRDERAGIADRQVVTTIGKYLQRHFVIPDHEIRDIVALHTTCGDMTIHHDMDSILEGARKGPHSCMSADIQVRCDDGHVRHPYEVYKPELGWSIALRRYEGRIDGRALIYKDDNHHYFVRSYKRDTGGGYSYADEALEAWLYAQGIRKLAGWSGARIAAYRVNDGYLAPYLDGCDEHVYAEDGVLVVTDERDDNTYEAQQTNGVTDECSHGEPCEDCGAHHDEDDMYWVGVHEDRRVGSCCIDEYTYAYSRRGDRYYIPNDRAVDVGGEWYDTEYFGDNDIVELADGEYSHIDNATYIESTGEYYDCNDDAICYADDTGQYELTDDCWMCEATCKWYTDDTEYVEVDGDKYHPDDAPEPAQAELELEAVADVTIAAEPSYVAVTTNEGNLTDSITYNYLRNAR